MWNSSATQDAVAHAGSDADWRTCENGFSPVHHVSSDQQTRLLHIPSQPLLYALPTTEAGRLYMGSSVAKKTATEVDAEQQAYTLLSKEGFARGREPYAASENLGDWESNSHQSPGADQIWIPEARQTAEDANHADSSICSTHDKAVQSSSTAESHTYASTPSESQPLEWKIFSEETTSHHRSFPPQDASPVPHPQEFVDAPVTSQQSPRLHAHVSEREGRHATAYEGEEPDAFCNGHSGTVVIAAHASTLPGS